MKRPTLSFLVGRAYRREMQTAEIRRQAAMPFEQWTAMLRTQQAARKLSQQRINNPRRLMR